MWRTRSSWKYKRVWVVRADIMVRDPILGLARMYLKDPAKTGRPGDWAFDKTNALFWSTKREAESEALLYATKHPRFFGMLAVTHRMKRVA